MYCKYLCTANINKYGHWMYFSTMLLSNCNATCPVSPWSSCEKIKWRRSCIQSQRPKIIRCNLFLLPSQNKNKGLKTHSFVTSSVHIQSTAAGHHVGAAILARVVFSCRSDLNAVICKWKGLMLVQTEDYVGVFDDNVRIFQNMRWIFFPTSMAN